MGELYSGANNSWNSNHYVYFCAMNFQETKHHRSAGKLIGIISRASQVYFHDRFKPYSIGHGQIRTLLFIARHKGLTQNAVADHFDMDKSSITSQIKILEENGYVKRERSEEDGRYFQLHITNKTKEILKPIKETHARWTDILMKGFSEDEQELLFDYLERMKNNAINEVSDIKDMRRHHSGGYCKHSKGKERNA